jgi:TonB family protein
MDEESEVRSGALPQGPLKARGNANTRFPTAAIAVARYARSAGASYFPKHIEDLRYPRLADLAGVQGQVTLDAKVAADGHVANIKVGSGPPLLQAGAKESLARWLFQPCPCAEEVCRVTVTFVFILDPDRARYPSARASWRSICQTSDASVKTSPGDI